MGKNFSRFIGESIRVFTFIAILPTIVLVSIIPLPFFTFFIECPVFNLLVRIHNQFNRRYMIGNRSEVDKLLRLRPYKTFSDWINPILIEKNWPGFIKIVWLQRIISFLNSALALILILYCINNLQIKSQQ